MDFIKLDGTTQSEFFINKRDKKIVSAASRFELKTAADALVPVSIADPIEPEDAVTLLAMAKGHQIFPITTQSTGKPASTGTAHYSICTIAGDETVGDIFYDDGTTVEEITKFNGMLIFTVTSLTGGTLELLAEKFYFYSTGDSSWHLIDTGSTTYGASAVTVSVGTTSTSSTFEIPTGSIVTMVKIIVDTVYDNNATIAVNIGSIGTSFADLSQEDTYTMFLHETLLADTAVSVTIANVPTVGASTVYVEYVIPRT